MTSVWRWAVVVAVLAVGVSTLRAERSPERSAARASGMQLMLLRQKSVQEDLKLSEDQAQQVQEFTTKQWKAFQGLRDLSKEERQQKAGELATKNEHFITDTLKPEQVKRLHQIALQVGGPMALHDPAVSKDLDLTDKQKEQLQTLQDEGRKEMREIFKPGGDREEMQKKFEELRTSHREKVMNILTDDQKTKWKELIGEPFKGELNLTPPGETRPEKSEK